MQTEYATVAQRIVRDSLRLTENDALRVQTSEYVLPLAKELIKEARRAGADTMLTVDADDVWYDAMLNLPLDWLRGPSNLVRALHGTLTAMVYAGSLYDPAPMRDIPGERWQANTEGSQATNEPWDDDPVPYVYVALGSVTEPRASSYGFDYPAWHDEVLAAMAVPPERMEERGTRIVGRLQNAREARLTAPGGTDVEFAFHGSEPTAWVGRLSPVKGRPSTYYQSLPEGSVGIALRQGSGEGQVVSTTPIPSAGDLIRGLSWDFQEGRVVEARADENLNLFTRQWSEKRRARGADQLGALVIGINPEAKYGFLNDDIVEGAVTLILGDNEDYDGANGSGFSFPIFLRDATLEVDGKALVVDGTLQV